MKYHKSEYKSYVSALKLNLNYSKVNSIGYGGASWLNCNDVK